MLKIKSLLAILLFSAVIFFYCPDAFAAYHLDGYLDDWGINPFFDWTPWDDCVDYEEQDYGGGSGVRPRGIVPELYD